jgi:hypothetical protein
MSRVPGFVFVTAILATFPSGRALASGWPPTGLPVATGVGRQGLVATLELPSFAFAGSPVSHAFLIWEDEGAAGPDGTDLVVASVIPAVDPVVQVTTLDAGPGRQFAPVADMTGLAPSTPVPPYPTFGVLVAYLDDPGDGGVLRLARAEEQSPHWPPGGVVVSSVAPAPGSFAVAGNVDGGGWVLWLDSRGGTRRIREQRFDIDGTPQLGADGVELLPPNGHEHAALRIARGSLGELFAMWLDTPSGGSGPELRAVRIDPNGSVHADWAPNGRLVASGSPIAPARLVYDRVGVLLDGEWTGGCIALWNEPDGSLRALRLLGDGTTAPGWAAQGVPLGASGVGQTLAGAHASEAGLFAAWTDARNLSAADPDNLDVYAQRLLMDGSAAPGWDPAGQPVRLAPGTQVASSLVFSWDAVLIGWHDDTPGIPHGWVQRLAAAGAAEWAPPGIAFPDPAHLNGAPQLAGDNQGGVFAAWEDYRNFIEGNTDIFCTHLNPDGAATAVQPAVSTVISLALAGPNPTHGLAAFVLDLPESRDVEAAVHDVGGRLIARLAAGRLGAGRHPLVWNQHAHDDRPGSAGVYFLVVRTGSETLTRRFVALR